MKKVMAITVQAREKGKKPKDLRKTGVVPGVVYGNKVENSPVQLNAKEFHAVYLTAGENKVVDVDVAGKKIPCLIHAVSLDPVTGNYEHVDFYAVDMKKKVTAKVPLVIKGESPAVKTQGGVLITVHDHLEVSCLPSDIPESFEIDISSLKEFHQSISVSALKIPANVTLKESPETVLVTVQEPRKEEEIAPPTPAEGEVPAEGATSEGAAPTAEGAAPAPGAAPAKAGAPEAKKEEKKK